VYVPAGSQHRLSNAVTPVYDPCPVPARELYKPDGRDAGVSKTLDAVSLLAADVAVAGTASVLFATSSGTDRGNRLMQGAILASVALFVGGMVWLLAIDPLFF
jgi:hypothetical protein